MSGLFRKLLLNLLKLAGLAVIPYTENPSEFISAK
jgi:hypothetical protein